MIVLGGMRCQVDMTEILPRDGDRWATDWIIEKEKRVIITRYALNCEDELNNDVMRAMEGKMTEKEKLRK